MCCVYCVYLYVYICVCVRNACGYVCTGNSVCVYKCVFVVRVCVYGCIPVRVYICVRVSTCVWLHVAAIRIRSCDPNPVTEDSDPIRIRIRRVPIRQAIQRPRHKMIRRSLPLHAVQTRRQFGPEITSFHVSVCFCVITYLPL